MLIEEPGNGAEWALRVSAIPIAGGRVLVVADDITDSVRVEDELVQVEKLLSLGTLAGGIVHDLASPLTAILGTAELLADAADTADRRQGLEMIVQAANYMRDICRGLTEFSRRARKGETTAAKVAEVVQKAVAFAGYAKKLQGIEAKTDVDPGLPDVSGSGSELTQVLVNLIVNACDAMQGSPAVTPDPDTVRRGGRLEIRARRSGRAVRIEVADTGPGIPADVQALIFAPFFTTKGAGKGTGLGLFTSRRIMKRLGGRLDYTTGPSGTTFVIEVPASGA
jgi:signal transduction histidine kinase